MPNIRRNLLSVSQIERKDKRLKFENGKVKIFNKRTRDDVGEAFDKDGLYVVNVENIRDVSDQTRIYVVGSTKIDENHK